MHYPASLLEQFGSAAAFCAAANAHRDAPDAGFDGRRTLTPAAVYMWRAPGRVPHLWRSVVRDLMVAAGAEDGPTAPAAGGDTTAGAA
jgi:hypothetical protein